MYEPCMNDCTNLAYCDPSCSDSAPVNCGTPAACTRHVRFSDLVPPSFLTERLKQTSGRPKPLHSKNTAGKVPRTNYRNRDKGGNNEKKDPDTNGNTAEGQIPGGSPVMHVNSLLGNGINSGNPSQSAFGNGNNSLPGSGYISGNPSQSAFGNGNNENPTQNTFGAELPPTLYQPQEAQMSCVEYCDLNQRSRPSSDIPAAGLPSRQCPRFDPCTGRELELQAQPTRQARACPATPGMYPCYCLTYQSYPSPTQAIEMAAMAQNQQPSGESEKTTGSPSSSAVALRKSPEEPENSESMTAVGEKSIPPASSKENNANVPKTRVQAKPNKTNATTQAKIKRTKGNVNRPNAPSREKNSKETQIVNCSDANPDLIDRICKSLQVPRPPESCYLLLPITMSDKVSKSEESVGSNGKKPSNAASKETSGRNSTSEDTASKPTRNCGCNTTISGNLEDNPQAPQSKSNEENDQTAQNCYGPCCSTGCGSGCNPYGCYWPRCSYYYNPYTGCYCWYKNRCCCSGNNCCINSCNQSCPIACSKPATPPQTNASPETTEAPNQPGATPNNQTDKDPRSVGGATTSSQLKGQKLNKPWMPLNRERLQTMQHV